MGQLLHLGQCEGVTLWLLSCTCATCGAAALHRAYANTMLLPLCRVATNLVRRLCERGECDTWMRFPAACCCWPRFPQTFGVVTGLSLVHRGGSCSHEADSDLAGCLHPCISAHCLWLFRNTPRCPDPGVSVHQHTGGGAKPPLLCGKYTVTLTGNCVHRNELSEVLELSWLHGLWGSGGTCKPWG